MSLLDGLLGDSDLARIMGDAAQIAAMLRVEAALARVEGRLGIIPPEAAKAIAGVAADLHPDAAALEPGTARAGIPAQALVTALRSACGPHADWVHFGATSQDIQDSALVLQLRTALEVMAERLGALDAMLAEKSAAFADQPIPARTRFQIAAPTTLGAKIAVWRAPLGRHLQRLDELRPRLFNVSFHGAAGTGAALSPSTDEVRRALADALGLSAPEIPWHATRDAIAELGGWLALVTGSLGKIGIDLILLGQSEIAEVAAGTGGGSSTMPQKSNPVAAEALVTLARLNAGDTGTLHQAMIHAQERDGAALGLEWAVLPQMVVRTGAALRIGLDLATTLVPRPERIAATFAADRGAMMAEAATFALSRQMPRAEAQRLVAEALRAVAETPDRTLAQALDALAPGGDWTERLRPARQTGEAARQADAGKPSREDKT
ncbi:adenylosuccinate lyase family protein [Tropicimonas sp. IMCC34043]|uniref:class-II fumarase/aspartase family protein n=1 Tax=Tropicimonas sp. IMCC34043 TaxID=2248760 RepID=UPI000E27CA07|nr:adenylosuccinate lyase family protein [Tropicimonas sp. IMCC34043]